ncbi:MAG: hypothetical protein DCC68_17855 [Planctomycetota bacterium]|nr:MAG: hypothetical protein DCC68_17855 [Planctomycetota bacterium]
MARRRGAHGENRLSGSAASAQNRAPYGRPLFQLYAMHRGRIASQNPLPFLRRGSQAVASARIGTMRAPNGWRFRRLGIGPPTVAYHRHDAVWQHGRSPSFEKRKQQTGEKRENRPFVTEIHATAPPRAAITYAAQHSPR